MTTLFVRHQVNDFAQWKNVYDKFAANRQAMGVTGASVHRDTSDPSIIIVTHQFQDLGTAQSFAGSNDLKSAMANAGVAGRPEMWFTEDIEQSDY